MKDMRARKKGGATQRNVADHFGYTTPQFISNWENSKIVPPLSTLREATAFYEGDMKQLYRFLAGWQAKIIYDDLFETDADFNTVIRALKR